MPRELSSYSFTLAATVVLGMAMSATASASGWTGTLTIVSVTEADYSGEVVQLIVSQAVDDSAGCPYHDAYMIRDANIINGSLALLLSAQISSTPISVLVSTTCDATGRPTVTAVQLD